MDHNPGVATPAWAPPPWLRKPLSWLQWSLSLAGAAALIFAAVRLVGDETYAHLLLGLALGWALAYANVALHELGHALAARAAGMHLLRMQIGLVELVGRRRGWDWRLKPPVLKVDGMVIAFPASGRPFHQQQLPFVLGGPAAPCAATSTPVVIARPRRPFARWRKRSPPSCRRRWRRPPFPGRVTPPLPPARV